MSFINKHKRKVAVSLVLAGLALCVVVGLSAYHTIYQAPKTQAVNIEEMKPGIVVKP